MPASELQGRAKHNHCLQNCLGGSLQWWTEGGAGASYNIFSSTKCERIMWTSQQQQSPIQICYLIVWSSYGEYLTFRRQLSGCFRREERSTNFNRGIKLTGIRAWLMSTFSTSETSWSQNFYKHQTFTIFLARYYCWNTVTGVARFPLL